MKKTPSGIVKAGAIINIIMGTLSVFTTFALFGFFGVIGIAIAILAIVFNAKILTGTAQSKTAAGVFGILVSLLGGIFVLVGKYE